MGERGKQDRSSSWCWLNMPFTSINITIVLLLFIDFFLHIILISVPGVPARGLYKHIMCFPLIL